MIDLQNKKIAFVCLCVCCGMLLLSFASVPLYRIFCQVTGYGGTIQQTKIASDIILDEKITVRFDANVSGGLAWQFEPLQRQIKVRIGEQAEVFYQAKNLAAVENFGTATFNVSPNHAGIYFNKIECFCFTQQTLAPNQSQNMAVAFFISPDIIDDPLLQTSKTITLSYTFYPDNKQGDTQENIQTSFYTNDKTNLPSDKKSGKNALYKITERKKYE